TSIGRCACTARSAASEYASLPLTAPSCRTPVGSVPGDSGLSRGRTMTSSIPSHVASEVKKSRLYCAMPPCPPNASVTSARTRNEGLTIKLPLGRCDLKGPAPRPCAFVYGDCWNSLPALDARVAMQPRLDGSFKPGLGTFDYLVGKRHTRTARENSLR